MQSQDQIPSMGSAADLVTIRADTQVQVYASSAVQAAEKAKEVAPAFSLAGIECDSLTVWIDESIDISQAQRS